MQVLYEKHFLAYGGRMQWRETDPSHQPSEERRWEPLLSPILQAWLAHTRAWTPRSAEEREAARELLARINAVLRRQAAARNASAIEGATTLTFLGWRIDIRLRELRNPEGARVAMTSAEFDLLRTFCERPGRVLSRDSLLDLTQGRSAGSFERSIDVLVSRIRRKIEPDPQEATMIKTVRSGGYVFTPRVEAVAATSN